MNAHSNVFQINLWLFAIMFLAPNEKWLVLLEFCGKRYIPIERTDILCKILLSLSKKVSVSKSEAPIQPTKKSSESSDDVK